MPDANLDKAVQFLFSALFSTIEELALRSAAYKQVLTSQVPHLESAVEEAEIAFRESDLAAQTKQIRLRAVQAVRDRNFDAVIELAGEMSGKVLPPRKGRWA